MDDIRRVLAAAGRRLLLNDALARLTVTLAIVLAAAMAVRIGQKLVPFEVPWGLALGLGSAAAVVGALAWAVLTRRGTLDVARHVDERAGLRESLSTALVVERAQDGWSRNIVESAGRSARRVVVRDAVPYSAPRLWAVPSALVLGLLCVWWLPSYDAAGLFERRALQEQQQAEVEQVRAEIHAADERLEELLKKANLDLEDGETAEPEEPLDPDAPIQAEELRRSAIKKLTSLAEQLEQKIGEAEQAKTMEQINDAMRRLKPPGDGPAAEMARELAKGNFAQARAELEQLAEQIASGEMSEQDQQRAAEQLQDLQSQLERMAEQREQLEEQLRQAGFSKEQAQQMAADPSQMQQQLDQNQSLSQEQKQQLQQASQAQQQASEAMQSACQAMGQMAEAIQNQSAGQLSDATGSMCEQLSQMEMMQAEMASAQAALSEARRQLTQMGQGQCEGGGQGPAFCDKPGSGNQWAGGFGGGAGRGDGLGAAQAPVDFTVRTHKANTNASDGPIIASMLVQGSQVRGESKATFSTVASSARAEAADAIEHSRVPRKHEAAVQHYFGRLEAVAGEPKGEGG